MYRKVLFIICLLLAAIVLTGLGISWFFGSEVKSYLVGEINKKLNTPVSVKEIRFSVFRHFPDASLEFEDVLIHEKNKAVPDTLFFAEKIILQMALSQLFSKSYTVKSIKLESALIYPEIDPAGSPNYMIWKEDNDSAEVAGFRLEHVSFSSTTLHFENRYKHLSFHTFIREGSLQGAFSEKQFTLESAFELDHTTFGARNVNYVHDKKAGLILAMKIDAGSGVYSILSSTLQMEGLDFAVKGVVRSVPEGLETDLHISSPGSDPKALVALMPHGTLTKINNYSYSGSVSFDMSVKGIVGNKKSPLVKINYRAAGVSMIAKAGGDALKNLQFTGFYTNRNREKGAVAFLSVKQFSASLNGRPVAGDFELTDFNKPLLAFTLNGSIDMMTLARFFKPDTVEQMSGLLTSAISFSGKIGQFSTYKAGGSIQVTNATISLKQNPMSLKKLNGQFTLHGNEVTVSGFNGQIGNTEFSADGTLSNLMSYLLLPNEKLGLNLSLQAADVNLDQFLEKNKSDTPRDTSYRLHFPENIDARIQLAVGHLKFQKFNSNTVSGTLTLAGQVLSSERLSFNSMDGLVSLKGAINAMRKDSILITADAIITRIDITKLFYELGNFGQDVIQDKNLKGIASADVQFASIWSAGLVCNTNQLYARATILVENGELIQFEPTQALSRYLKGADLRNIRFSTLKDVVEIRNRVIHFSHMEVKSSALDLTASGTHTFDHMVDYKITLLLSHLLGKKVKEQNTEFGTIEDDGLGRTRLFLRMTGPMKNPKFKYDNTSVEEKIEKDLSNEKQNLKQVLNKEFGWFKKDTMNVKKKPETPLKEDIQIDYEEETEEK